MRKKTISFLSDTIFWYLIYFLPVLSFLLYLVAGGTLGIESFLLNFDFIISNDNIIAVSLKECFYTGGIMPLFSSDTIFIIVSWFASVLIVHLFIDVLIFIPRLAHKWLGDCTKVGD